MGRGGDVAAVARAARASVDATYEHIVVEEQRREWERTKEDLGAARKQIAEKDTAILQLKTQVRKLQETLQKKDKDLQAAFAMLRAPQDAELTKKLKQELIDRLVMENQQRVVSAEAIAEERKKELDRLKYSSKFLRYQELEVELDEYRQEIERLRALVSITASGRSPGIVVGKLKISAMQSSGASLNPEPDARSLSIKKTLRAATTQGPTRSNSANNNNASTVSKLDESRVLKHGKVLLTKPETSATNAHKESFVTKTRRRAQEAEYYKQVRLAQLEAECELEENIHIRTAREVKARLEAEKKWQRQEHEAAIIRERIAMLQQRQVMEEAEAKQQQEQQSVVTVSAEPRAAQTERDKSDGEQEGGLENREVVESVDGPKPGPAEVHGRTPASAEEAEDVPVSSSQPQETRETAVGDDPVVKAIEELDVYESFSEDAKPRQDQVPTSSVSADTATEQVKGTKPTEVEHSNDDEDPETEYTEDKEEEAEIEEDEVKTLPVVGIPSAAVADDPLETSEVHDEDEEEAHGKMGDVTGPDKKSEHSPPSSAPAAALVAGSGHSYYLYEEENFDDDPKDDEPEQQASVETAEQPRPGFLVDAVDPHTRPQVQEPSEEHAEHDSSIEVHRQGFLLDVVDPHSRITSGQSQQINDPEQEAKDQKAPPSRQHDSSESAKGTQLETVSWTQSRLLGVQSMETNEASGAAISDEVDSASSNNVAAGGEAGNVDKDQTQSVAEILTAESVVEAKQEHPSACFAEDEADVIQVQAERPVTEDTPNPDDREAVELIVREDIATTQITSGSEPVSDTRFLSLMHLTAAELKEAMDAAARKIQQFWRQMDARFRRALDEDPTASGTIGTEAEATSSDDAIQASSPAAEKVPVEVEEEKPIAVADTAVSDSEAASPSYTPYSTPRDAESDDPQSPLQGEQDAEQHELERSREASLRCAQATFAQHRHLHPRPAGKWKPEANKKKKMISCVAVIGAANSPLYIRTFDEEEDLGFHYIAHVSLDIIEEKLRSAGTMTAKDDMYLGFLGPIEDYRAYGYVTNTSIKFVAIMQDSPVRESELRSFFAELHKMYVNAVSNPFAPIGERITSQSFEKKVYNLVLTHNTANA